MAQHDHRSDFDHYSQPGILFRSLAPDAKTRLIRNIVGSMKTVPKRIPDLSIHHFCKADPEYGTGVAKGLGLDVAAIVNRKAANSTE